MKNFIKRLPLLGKIALSLKRRLLPGDPFTTSEAYWIKRYQQGGNSGAGSYHQLAAFKGEVLNSFVARHPIATIIEFGCGDGNQLKYLDFPAYLGFDVSEVAIGQCRQLFQNDPSKQFLLVSQAANHRADLTLSLDVIYHLIEDDTYRAHMASLFAASTHYVIIYACDDDQPANYAPHVKPRKFTEWVTKNRPDFRLIEHIPNRFPLEAGKTDTTSFSDFYIYQKQAAA